MAIPAARGDDEPADGPWWSRPHPLLALDLPTLEADRQYEFASPTVGSGPTIPPLEGLGLSVAGSPSATSKSPSIRQFPGPLTTLDGAFRLQAVWRPHRADPTPGGPGELRSKVAWANLAPDRSDEITLSLAPSTPRPEAPTRILAAAQTPMWIEVESPSPLLESSGAGTNGHHAWVVFPRGYHDLAAPRRTWPAIYLVPHEGDGYAEATALRDAIAIERANKALPQAVWIVLDPTSPWGHHGFADSPVQGPRGTALVEEFVPELEARFRIEPTAAGRVLTGHGAGGWAALWLLHQYPETFSSALVTSPEAVDLSRIGTVDAYGFDAFRDADGQQRPAYREAVAGRGEAVRTMVDQEWRLAEAASSKGRSGDRWHRLAARMSPLNESGTPRPLFDEQGTIDRSLAAGTWLRYDLAAALARSPRQLVPLWDRRIEVWVGSLDESFNDRALLSLRSLIGDLRRGLGLTREGEGQIELVSGATFDTVAIKAKPDLYESIIRRLRSAGLHD